MTAAFLWRCVRCALVAGLLLALLASAARGQERLAFAECRADGSVVKIRISGWSPTTCMPHSPVVTVTGDRIDLVVNSVHPPTKTCFDVGTFWTLQYETDPLADGVYRVYTTILPDEPAAGPMVTVACAAPRCEPSPFAGDPVGLNGPVRAMTRWDPDGAGPLGEWLVIAGEFSSAGGVIARRVAAWDGSGWRALGTGIDGENDEVTSLAVFNGELVVGGAFSSAGGVTAFSVAAWNGTAWHGFGSGVTGEQEIVSALAVYKGELVAGGRFAMAGGTPAINIASWDGEQWKPLAEGFQFSTEAMTLFGDDLVAGGTGAVRRWDGSAWHAMGEGFPAWFEVVMSLTVYRGEVVAGTALGLGGTGGSLAFWDGAQWVSRGQMWNWPALAFTVLDDALFASSGYAYRDMIDLTRWDGASWSYVSNADGPVWALGSYQGELVAGGEFTSMGDAGAAHLARWGCTAAGCAADLTGDGVVDFPDYLEFLNLYEALDPRVDFSGDGVVDFGDYLEFLNHFDAGC